jgi:hypothetical protein
VEDVARPITEKDLKSWKLLQAFQESLEAVFAQAPLHPSFSDRRREMGYGRYLSVFLFGLFNPVVESMRGLCRITELSRVQREVSGGAVRPSSFSELQHLLDPALLQRVFAEIKQKSVRRGPAADTRLVHLNLVAQDSSLWRALPRMSWAEYGAGRKGDAKGVRLHLRFQVIEDQPLAARITRGKDCERESLRQMCLPGQTTVGDRYYGEDYQLFGEIDRAQGFFVLRIRADAVIHLEQELAVTPEDRAAGVVRHAWVRLGAREKSRSMRLRLVEIQAADQRLLLVTNLALDTASAELVGTIYRRRWSIEMFFRWIKCILGSRHFFAESFRGVAIQLYLTLIAALLLEYYTGRRPNKRSMELIQMYLLGWATPEELTALLQKQPAQVQARKKS